MSSGPGLASALSGVQFSHLYREFLGRSFVETLLTLGQGRKTSVLDTE